MVSIWSCKNFVEDRIHGKYVGLARERGIFAKYRQHQFGSRSVEEGGATHTSSRLSLVSILCRVVAVRNWRNCERL